MAKELWQLLALYLVCVNLCAFLLMGIDKRRAKKDRFRIPERTLFLPVVLGGGLGGIVGMKLFRHKTKHRYFHFGFPAIFLTEFILLALLLWKFALS